MKTIFPQLQEAQGAFTAVPIGEISGMPAVARVMQAFEGSFHSHQASDEMFVVLSGLIYLDFDASSITLERGQCYTVPARVMHRSRVPERAELIVIGGQD
jgi:mannose-6-phosphate isomerase-like protein (cupin superfamily)